MTTKIPSEIRVSKDKKTVTLGYKGDEAVDFAAEMLRVFSPSAEVQGHSPDQRQLVSGKRDVEIMKIEPIGNYAIRITFDDMHDTGIFSWEWFGEMAGMKEDRWADYLAEIEANGLSRDPGRPA